MATKLYFRDIANDMSGTFPSGPTLTPAWSVSGASTLKKMTTTKGSSQVSASGSSLAQTTTQNGFLGWWVSPPIQAGTYFGSLINEIFNVAVAESNANMDLVEDFRAAAYIWRPSTGASVASLITSGNVFSGDAEPNAINTEKVCHCSRSGTPTSATLQDGDVLIVEIYSRSAQGAAASYTGTVYFNGTTENTTTNATVSDHASYFEMDATLNFMSDSSNGDLNVTLEGLAKTIDGTVAVVGDESNTLGALTSSSGGTVDVVAALTVTLDNMTLSASGGESTTITGSLTVTLGDMSPSLAGGVLVAGAEASTLATMTLAAAATAAVTGAVAQTMGALTSSSGGAVNLVGAATITLGAVTLVSANLESSQVGLDVFTSAFSGPMGDRIHNFLLFYTVGTNKDWTNKDLWMKFLAERGHTSGTLADRIRRFLLAYNSVADTGQTVEDLWGLVDHPYTP